MSTVDPFTHMEEAWKLEANPFPSGAVRRGGATRKSDKEPYSPDVFPDETHDFYRKIVRGGVLDTRPISFLWSQGRRDTGYGKTTLMQAVNREINEDFGGEVLRRAGMRENRLVPIASTYATFNNLNATGLYPVLFDAVIATATPDLDSSPLLEKVRDRVVGKLADDGEDPPDDPDKIREAVLSAKLEIDPSGAPLRPELVGAFAKGGSKELLRQLAGVSQASRLRNGLQYLDFLIAVLAAADVHHLFVFVDQLEDLAMNKAIGSAKRSKEIGRIRDFMEKEPYASSLHFVFTFHNTAAKTLEPFWNANRLPRFEIAPDNTASMVVLRGLSNDDQVEQLLRVYLEDKRIERVEDDLLPLEPSALSVLRDVSEGRVGTLLSQAHQLLHGAAELGRPRINGDFADQYFRGSLGTTTESTPEDTVTSSDVDDILLA